MADNVFEGRTNASIDPAENRGLPRCASQIAHSVASKEILLDSSPHEQYRWLINIIDQR